MLMDERWEEGKKKSQPKSADVVYGRTLILDEFLCLRRKKCQLDFGILARLSQEVITEKI